LTYPSEKYEFVSWDDDIPNIWKNKSHVPNHQPDRDSTHKNGGNLIGVFGIFEWNIGEKEETFPDWNGK